MAIISGTNDPQGTGATTALALAREDVRLARIHTKNRQLIITSMMKTKLKLTWLTVISKPTAEI
jgi:hypothetical protein